MKVVQINATCGAGSTGKICLAVSEELSKKGIENYILYSSGESEYPLGIKYQNSSDIRIQALKSRILGNYGFNATGATKSLICELKRISPDIIHLHNIHGHNCNLEILFKYIKKHNIKVYWTFHDCWAFTGYCPYFTVVECDKWKTQCENCLQKKRYTWFFDRSSMLFEKKKSLFSDLDLTIITPSKWLEKLVKESFFKEYPVKVINNGIDLSVFKPTESDFRKKHNIAIDEFVILGVAFGWEYRKGLDVFLDLEKRIDKDKYRIVLVGTDDAVDKQLPNDIVSIHRTSNQTELAEIYSAADLFVNPTREENYPTVNMEAIACGTPVVTFKTGGSPEMLDEKTGLVIADNDVEVLVCEIERICEQRPFLQLDCLDRAKSFDMNSRFKEYVELYEKL